MLHCLQYVTEGKTTWGNSSNHHSHEVGYITLLVCLCSADLLVNEIMLSLDTEVGGHTAISKGNLSDKHCESDNMKVCNLHGKYSHG